MTHASRQGPQRGSQEKANEANRSKFEPSRGRGKRTGGGLRKPASQGRLFERAAPTSDARRDRLAAYLDQRPPVSEQVRRAIDASGQSRYAICKATGIDQGQLSKFMAGKLGLSLDALDVLCAYLGAELRCVRLRKGG